MLFLWEMLPVAHQTRLSLICLLRHQLTFLGQLDLFISFLIRLPFPQVDIMLDDLFQVLQRRQQIYRILEWIIMLRIMERMAGMPMFARLHNFVSSPTWVMLCRNTL